MNGPFVFNLIGTEVRQHLLDRQLNRRTSNMIMKRLLTHKVRDHRARWGDIWLCYAGVFTSKRFWLLHGGRM